MAIKMVVVVGFLLFAGASGPAAAASAGAYSSAPFRPGEVLHYKVKWGPIRLGTLEISQDRSGPADSGRYSVKLTGRSAKGVPFLHVLFADRAVLDSRSPSNWIFTSEDSLIPQGATTYRSDSSATHMSIVETLGGRVTKSMDLSHTDPLYDCIGLLMLIRGLSGSHQEVLAQTVVEKQVRNTRLNFTEEIKDDQPDAFAYPIRLRRFEGHGEWMCKSCAGMTGKFGGWVTDDEAAIPVEMSVKIGVGSVSIKLESFTRPGGGPTAGSPSGSGD